MRVTVVPAVVLILGLAGLITMDHQSSPSPAPEPSPPRRVSVRLLGSAETITGMEVPKDLAHRNDVYLRVQEPADVSVQLPGGRAVQMTVKYTSINVDHSVVVDVHLLPLMHSVPYKEAVAELHRLLRDLGIPPDERMRKEIAGWPDNVPGASDGFFPHAYRAEVQITESVTFLVKLRPAPDGGWFLALTFAADGDARRAVWDPSAPRPNGK